MRLPARLRGLWRTPNPLYGALIYLLATGAYILLSDRLVLALTPDLATATRLQTYKGLAFIALTSVLVYALLRRGITAARRAEVRTLTSETRHRQMFEGNQAVQLIIDPQTGDIIDANPAAVEFYGYSGEQLRRMRITEINTLPEKEVRAAMQRAARLPTDRFHFQHRLASGEIRDVEVVSNPFDLDGHTYLYSIIRDTTDLRQTEAALQDSERRFRAIFDRTFQFIALLNPDGSVIEANQTSLDFARATREEVVGKPFWEGPWWSSADRPRIREAIREAAGGQFARHQVEIHGVGGALAMDFSLKPVTDETGNVALLIAEGRDIDDLRRLLRTLRETNQTLEALVAASPLPIAVLDTDGNVRIWNPAAERVFGWPTDEVLGRPFPLPGEQERAAFEGRLRSVLGGESFSGLEGLYYRRDGSPVHVSASYAPLRDAARRVSGAVVLAADITESRRAAALQSALYRIAALSGTADDLPEFYAAIHQVVSELMYARNFYIALYDPATDILSFPYFVDETEPPPPPQPLGEGLTAQVIRTGQPMLISEPEARAQAARGELQLLGTPMVDWIGVPLKRGDQTFGVLAVQSYTPAVRFGERDRDLLTFVSQHIANALVRQQDAEALRESEARYRSLFDQVPVGLYRTAPDGRILEANPALLDMLGCPDRESLVGQNTLQFHVRPSDRDRVRAALEETDTVRGFPMELRRRDGVLIQVEEDSRAIRDERGHLLYYEGAFQDVTERRRAEAALRESEARYRTLIETSPDAVIYTDLNGVILLANQQAALLYGLDAVEELVGRSWFELIASEDCERAIYNARLTLQTGHMGSVEYALLRADGSPFPAEVSTALVRDPDGTPAGFVGVARDITERKRAEAAEREQRALAEALRDSAAALNSTLNLDDLFERILANVGRVVPHDAANIMLIEGDAARVVRRLGYAEGDWATAVLGMTFNIHEMPTLKAMLDTGEPLVISDVHHYEGWTVTPPIAWIHSAAGAPIRHQDQVVGFINLYSREVGFFTSGHGHRLQAFADQVAVALQNAWLYESERRQLKLAQTLQAVGALLTSSLSLEEVLDHILGLLAEVIQSDSVSIQLLTEEGALDLAAARGFPDLELARQVIRSLPVQVLEDRWAEQDIAAIGDTLADPTWIPTPKEIPIRSWIGAALRVRGQLIGSLNLDWLQPQTFNDATLETVLAFANQAAIAIENARLSEANRRRVDELETLRRVTLDITSQLDLSELLSTLVWSALRLLGVDSGGMYLYRPGRGVLEWGVSIGPDSAPLGVELERGEGLAGKVWDTGQPLIVEDYATWEGRSPRLSDYDFGAVIGVPVRWGEEFLGVITAVSGRSPRRFSEADARLLGLFADQAAIAIVNARLFESERQQRQVAETITETTAAVASSLDLGRVLLTLASRLRQISGFDLCTIYEWDPGRGEVRALAERARVFWPDADTEVYALAEFPVTLRVLETGQPALVCLSDPDPDPGEAAWMRSRGLEAVLLLPVWAGEAVVGLAEIGCPAPGFADGQPDTERCLALLRDAARWLAAPLTTNTGAALLELAQVLASSVSAPWCTLSTWDREAGEVRSVAMHSELVWQPGQGPAYLLTERPTIAEALERGSAVVARVDDPTIPPATRERLAQWGMSLLVAQPLAVRGTVIGLVELNDTTGERPVNPAELRLWRVVADQAAVAIEHARLYAHSQEQVEHLALLNAITRIGTETLDLKELLQTLADTAGQIIGGDGCFITLWDPATLRVQPAAASGPQRETYPLNEPTGPERRTLTRSVIEAGHPIAIPDVFDTPYMDRAFADPHPIKSLLGIPLQADGRDLGALLIGFNNPHEFSEDEIGWANQAAELIALAIAKAQAYADLERRVEERTEQLHQTNQRLLKATQLKDEFVANVSHELRTPVTSIKLYHHLLRATPERFEPYMDRLERETARLEFIIEDLLRISEIDRKQAVPNLALTDLNALVGPLITDRTALAEQQHHLNLAFRPEAALPAVRIDPRLVGQAVSILLTNALNYTPAGGQVTVSTRLAQVEGQPWVTVAVSDTGPGIPPDEMPRLFQRFFRGKVGRESNRSGTGLGLAIASEIVALHGGRIEAASEGIPGKGATFTIWLPVNGATEGKG